MPDPVLYSKAMGAAALVSALLVLAVGAARRPVGALRANLACLLAVVLGASLGFALLKAWPAWPPASALDRFLTIVLPAAILVELIAAPPRTPGWLAWLLRLCLAAAMGSVLLYASTYMSGPRREWTIEEAVITLAACGVLPAAVWALMVRLSHRSPGVSLPIALVFSILTAGAAVMLAGYVSGGAAAFPLAAAILGASLALPRIAQRPDSPATVGMGVVSLFGVLFIGRYFGGLSTPPALAVLLAPLLCWTTEIPWLRRRKPWLVGALRLLLVAIPLLVVLALAKQEFDRELGPLLIRQPPNNTAPSVVGEPASFAPRHVRVVGCKLGTADQPRHRGAGVITRRAGVRVGRCGVRRRLGDVRRGRAPCASRPAPPAACRG